MIYIFEDRRSRQENNEYIEAKYLGLVLFVKFDIEESENLEDYICEKYLDADCVIFHKSYTLNNQRLNIEIIKDFFIRNNISFVIFSGGIEKSRTNRPELSATINADIMYDNLESFVKYYKETGDINLDILVWGEEYRKNKILSLHYEIMTQKDLPVNFIEYSPDAIISADDIDETLRKVILKFKRAGVDIKDIMKTEIDRYGKISIVSDLRNILDSVINKIMLL